MKITKKSFVAMLVGFGIATTLNAGVPKDSEHAKKALEIYRNVISIPTVAGRGNVPKMANYLASELKQAGFNQSDIQVIPHGETAALIVRYRGDGSAKKKPILLIAHMDVVEALPEDWKRPPFELTQDDIFFYGRGTEDNKLGVTMLTSTFIKLKKSGFVPNRDLIIAFSGDEETSMSSTIMLASNKELLEAEYVLNSDAGGGALGKDGKALSYAVQAAEKTYASFKLTVSNPGGHSSRPRPDNAIYDLSAALNKLQAHRFPVRSAEMTRGYFRATGKQLGGELGTAMIQFADNPQNQQASDRLAIESSYVGATRTTCVPTLLSGGHAENALPQSASVTINCRIFPGVRVADVKAVLVKVIDNSAIEFSVLDEPIESPISDLRSDVMAAVSKAVHKRHPGVAVFGFMSSGATDGMHFRSAGLPTLAVSSIFMDPDDNFAHGLNERLPIKTFYNGLGHWEIILRELAGQ